jgi:hypothetical protein
LWRRALGREMMWVGEELSELFLTWSEPLLPPARLSRCCALGRSNQGLTRPHADLSCLAYSPPRFRLTWVVWVVMMVLTSCCDSDSMPLSIRCPCAMPGCQVEAGGGSGGGGSRIRPRNQSQLDGGSGIASSAPSHYLLGSSGSALVAELKMLTNGGVGTACKLLQLVWLSPAS